MEVLSTNSYTAYRRPLIYLLSSISSDQEGHRSAKVERKSSVECQPASLGQLTVSTCLNKINKRDPIYKVYKVLGDQSRETVQPLSSCHN